MMSFQVSLLKEDPPIVLLYIEGDVTPPDMVAHIDEIERVLREHQLMETFNYAIVDVRHVTMTFADVLKGAMTHRVARRGSSGDPMSQSIFIGNQTNIRVLRDLFVHQHASALMPIFETYEEAYAFIQELDEYQGHAQERANNKKLDQDHSSPSV
jgi:hypothetical protein